MTDPESNPLENYSPFEHPEQDTRPKKLPSRSYTPTPVSEDDDEEIRAYEQRLNVLESRLNAQETQLAVAQESGLIEPPANWPKFYPLVHFDVEEVAPALQSYAHQAMFSWCMMVISFTLNWLCCLTLLKAGDVSTSPGSKIALSSLYLFVIVPLALDLAALSIYRALKDDPSSFTYLKIFATLGFAMAFEGTLSLGLDSSGSCGLITMLTLYEKGYWIIGFIAILVTASFSYTTYLHYKLLVGLWKYYKGTEQGSSLETDVKKSLAVMVVEALK